MAQGERISVALDIGAPTSVQLKTAGGASAVRKAEKNASRNFERLFDLPFGVEEYSDGAKRYDRTAAHVIVGAVAGLCKAMWRYEAKGVEKLYAIAEDSGVVVVSNHTSYLDVVFMYLSMWPRKWPRFMARDTLFTKNSLLGWAIAQVGAFPVSRDTADRTSVKRAVRMLRN